MKIKHLFLLLAIQNLAFVKANVSAAPVAVRPPVVVAPVKVIVPVKPVPVPVKPVTPETIIPGKPTPVPVSAKPVTPKSIIPGKPTPVPVPVKPVPVINVKSSTNPVATGLTKADQEAVDACNNNPKCIWLIALKSWDGHNLAEYNRLKALYESAMNAPLTPGEITTDQKSVDDCNNDPTCILNVANSSWVTYHNKSEYDRLLGLYNQSRNAPAKIPATTPATTPATAPVVTPAKTPATSPSKTVQKKIDYCNSLQQTKGSIISAASIENSAACFVQAAKASANSTDADAITDAYNNLRTEVMSTQLNQILTTTSPLIKECDNQYGDTLIGLTKKINCLQKIETAESNENHQVRDEVIKQRLAKNAKEFIKLLLH